MLGLMLIAEKLSSGDPLPRGFRVREVADLKNMNPKEFEAVVAETLALESQVSEFVREVRKIIAGNRYPDSAKVILAGRAIFVDLSMRILPPLVDALADRSDGGSPLESIRGGEELRDCIERCKVELATDWQTPDGPVGFDFNRPAEVTRMRDRFEALAERWAAEIGPSSSIQRVVDCPAYREIVAMGPAILPLVIEQLKSRSRRKWLFVLEELTGEDPVPDDAAGNIPRITEAWLRWWDSRKVA